MIVFATGFSGNLRQVVADTFGSSIADQLEDFWGMDTEGETNGAFKPSGRECFSLLATISMKSSDSSSLLALKVRL